MRTAIDRPAPLRRERGAALMIMMLILVLGAAAFLVRDLSQRGSALERTRDSAAALAAAKEAVLGYALTYDAAHIGELGFLPCPDVSAAGVNAEGSEDTTLCGLRYANVMGRLPWRTLGVAPARTTAGECLLYAVSGNWKASGLTQAELLNPDSNGQLRLFAPDGGALVAGANAAERAVALIVAPHDPLAGQLRATLAAGVDQCSGNYTLAGYLDDAFGIDNANVAVVANAIDDFIGGATNSETVNDQFAVITRAEIEQRLMRRPDVATKLAGLTDAVAKCVADYGRRNPGGSGDRRLPWPAPIDLAQYRADTDYDDTPIGWLSGRVADRVNDSNSRTGNTLANVLNNCNAVAVPEWTAERRALWRNWKDHLFYAVAGSFRPDASPHSTCGTCLSVNGAGTYAAVVMFAGARLPTLAQVRDEPPDTDTRGTLTNYLEGRNATNHPNTAGNANYQSGAAGAAFNDLVYCISPTLGVSAC